MAAPLLPPNLREGDRLTRDEFMRRWEQMPELKRAELIDGVVYMASPVTKTHGNFQLRLSFWLGYYVSLTPGCSAGADATWMMSENSVPQPDVALEIKPEFGGQSRTEGDYAAGAPELIVEISHTTARKDTGAKLHLYERSGVREYVTVKPQTRQIVWRELADGKYRDLSPDERGYFHSRVFPGLWLDPTALWNGDLSGLAAAVMQGIATPEHIEFVRLLENRRAG